MNPLFLYVPGFWGALVQEKIWPVMRDMASRSIKGMLLALSFVECTLYKFMFSSFKSENEIYESKGVSPKAPNSVHECELWVYTFTFLISQPGICFPYVNLYSSFNNCSREAWGVADNWGLIIYLVVYFYSNCGNI